MNDTTLNRIRQQELDLQARLLAARQQAETLVQAAHIQTDDIRRTAEANTADEVARLRQDIATETAQAIDAIRTDYERQAAAMAGAATVGPVLVSRLLAAITGVSAADRQADSHVSAAKR